MEGGGRKKKQLLLLMLLLVMLQESANTNPLFTNLIKFPRSMHYFQYIYLYLYFTHSFLTPTYISHLPPQNIKNSIHNRTSSINRKEWMFVLCLRNHKIKYKCKFIHTFFFLLQNQSVDSLFFLYSMLLIK